MIDVSVYGSHAMHASGFQSNEPGSDGYPYLSSNHQHHYYHQRPAVATVDCANPSDSRSFNSQIIGSINSATNNCTNSPNYTQQQPYSHSHLYSPSAIEYGITTSNSPSDLYFDSESQNIFYNNGQTGSTPFQQTRIISADNGLSYTNLDYMYSQQDCGDSLINQENKLRIHRYGTFGLPAVSDNTSSEHSVNHHHTIPTNTGWSHQIYGENNVHHSQQNCATGFSPANVLEPQVLHSARLESDSKLGITDSSQNTSSSESNSALLQLRHEHLHQQNSHNAPTYKWMQVKRNVPKPPSKLSVV